MTTLDEKRQLEKIHKIQFTTAEWTDFYRDLQRMPKDLIVRKYGITTYQLKILKKWKRGAYEH